MGNLYSDMVESTEMKTIYFNRIPGDWLSERVYTTLPANKILGDDLAETVAKALKKVKGDERKLEAPLKRKLLDLYRATWQLMYHSATNYSMRHKLRVLNKGVRFNERDKLSLYLGPIIVKAIKSFSPTPGVLWSQYCSLKVTPLIEQIIRTRNVLY